MLTNLIDQVEALAKNAEKFGLKPIKPDGHHLTPVRGLSCLGAPLRRPIFDHKILKGRKSGHIEGAYLAMQSAGQELMGLPTTDPAEPDYAAVGRQLAALADSIWGADGVPGGVYPCSDRFGFRGVVEAAGFTWLGNGFFSVVLAHPDYPGLALKCGLKHEDSGAMYAMWCRANPGRHVPEIKFTARYGSMYFVVMPQYHKYADGEYPDLDAAYNLARRCVYDPLCPIGVRAMRHVGLEPMAKVASAIGEFFKGIADIDVHAGNVMVRRNKYGHTELIITDPVSMRTGKAPDAVAL